MILNSRGAKGVVSRDLKGILLAILYFIEYYLPSFFQKSQIPIFPLETITSVLNFRNRPSDLPKFANVKFDFLNSRWVDRSMVLVLPYVL